MLRFFKRTKPLERSDHIILIEPKPIDYMGTFTAYLEKFDEVFGHTPLGLVFVRNTQTNEYATVVPFESNFYDIGIFESIEEFTDTVLSDDGLLPSAYLRVEDVNTIRKRLGELGKEEVYIPQPYPFLGGSCRPETYDKGNIWVFIAIISEMVCSEEGHA